MKSARVNKNKKMQQTAIHFYLKLYCNRKTSKKSKYYNTLVEAMKSWVSLSEAEKHLFNAKILECTEKHTTQCLEQLKFAEIFMKTKDIAIALRSKEDENLTANNKETEVCEENADEFANATSTEIQQIDASERISINEEHQLEIPVNNISEINVHHEHQEEENDDSTKSEVFVDDPPPPILIEPFTPTIKSGQELFYMLNTTEENDRTTWASLPQHEKSRYSRAVSIMKKDYITKYREYLESLSSKELFEHYNKTVF